MFSHDAAEIDSQCESRQRLLSCRNGVDGSVFEPAHKIMVLIT